MAQHSRASTDPVPTVSMATVSVSKAFSPTLACHLSILLQPGLVARDLHRPNREPHFISFSSKPEQSQCPLEIKTNGNRWDLRIFMDLLQLMEPLGTAPSPA